MKKYLLIAACAVALCSNVTASANTTDIGVNSKGIINYNDSFVFDSSDFTRMYVELSDMDLAVTELAAELETLKNTNVTLDTTELVTNINKLAKQFNARFTSTLATNITNDTLLTDGVNIVDTMVTILETNSLASETKATAKDGDILKGKTAYVNGQKVTGTMPANSASDKELASGTTIEYKAGYYPSDWSVKAAEAEGDANVDIVVADTDHRSWSNAYAKNITLAPANGYFIYLSETSVNSDEFIGGYAYADGIELLHSSEYSISSSAWVSNTMYYLKGNNVDSVKLSVSSDTTGEIYISLF